VKEVMMPKEIILYNLAENVTDEEYREYVEKEKGPFLDSLPSVEKFELVKILGSAAGEIPYRYVADFQQRDAPSAAFQDFMAKWRTKVADFHILAGEEVY
jgi:hypothetical protein